MKLGQISLWKKGEQGLAIPILQLSRALRKGSANYRTLQTICAWSFLIGHERIKYGDQQELMGVNKVIRASSFRSKSSLKTKTPKVPMSYGARGSKILPFL